MHALDFDLGLACVFNVLTLIALNLQNITARFAQCQLLI